MRITIADLADACPDQVALFEKTFGESVAITAANICKAAKAGINVDWAVNHLGVFTPIFAEYEKASAGILIALLPKLKAAGGGK